MLLKPKGSLPGQYQLNYYRDEQQTKFRGSINLDQCEQIIESLESKSHKHLFTIKTEHKSQERTYFLSTETEKEMIQWVHSLCTVCGMKPDDDEHAGGYRPKSLVMNIDKTTSLQLQLASEYDMLSGFSSEQQIHNLFSKSLSFHNFNDKYILSVKLLLF